MPRILPSGCVLSVFCCLWCMPPFHGTLAMRPTSRILRGKNGDTELPLGSALATLFSADRPLCHGRVLLEPDAEHGIFFPDCARALNGIPQSGVTVRVAATLQ